MHVYQLLLLYTVDLQLTNKLSVASFWGDKGRWPYHFIRATNMTKVFTSVVGPKMVMRETAVEIRLNSRFQKFIFQF